MKASQGKGMLPEVDYRPAKTREGRALQTEAVRGRSWRHSSTWLDPDAGGRNIA